MASFLFMSCNPLIELEPRAPLLFSTVMIRGLSFAIVLTITLQLAVLFIDSLGSLKLPLAAKKTRTIRDADDSHLSCHAVKHPPVHP